MKTEAAKPNGRKSAARRAPRRAAPRIRTQTFQDGSAVVLDLQGGTTMLIEARTRLTGCRDARNANVRGPEKKERMILLSLCASVSRRGFPGRTARCPSIRPSGLWGKDGRTARARGAGGGGATGAGQSWPDGLSRAEIFAKRRPGNGGPAVGEASFIHFGTNSRVAALSVRFARGRKTNISPFAGLQRARYFPSNYSLTNLVSEKSKKVSPTSFADRSEILRSESGSG